MLMPSQPSSGQGRKFIPAVKSFPLPVIPIPASLERQYRPSPLQMGCIYLTKFELGF